MWPAPLSTVWHWAHLVLKIFSPAAGFPGGASSKDAIWDSSRNEQRVAKELYWKVNEKKMRICYAMWTLCMTRKLYKTYTAFLGHPNQFFYFLHYYFILLFFYNKTYSITRLSLTWSKSVYIRWNKSLLT